MKRITCLILTWTLSATLFLSLPATPAWAEKTLLLLMAVNCIRKAI